MQDPSLIIDYVERAFPELPSVHPTTPKQNFVSYLFELYADVWLKLPAMHYRWSFLKENQQYLLWEWGRTAAPLLSAEEREKIVLRTKGNGHSLDAWKIRPVFGISTTIAPEVERSFLELLALLEAHFRVHKYLLGDKPCMGDFALMGPMYAHLYRDPKPSAIMRSKAPAFCEYIERMNAARPAYDSIVEYDRATKKLVPSKRGTNATAAEVGKVTAFGGYLPNDEIPSMLLPIIRKIFEEQVPVLLSAAHRLKEDFAACKTGFDEEMFETVGFHTFQLGEVQERRQSFPHDIWMLERCMDSINQPDIVHPFIRRFPNGPLLLDNWGWINTELRLRLVKFRLYRDPSTPGRLVQSRL